MQGYFGAVWLHHEHNKGRHGTCRGEVMAGTEWKTKGTTVIEPDSVYILITQLSEPFVYVLETAEGN